jgi:hypothetical protein
MTNYTSEIHDYKAKIADIETELTELGEDIKPSQPPQVD